MEEYIREITIWGEGKDLKSLFLLIKCMLENGMMECIKGMVDQKLKIN